VVAEAERVEELAAEAAVAMVAARAVVPVAALAAEVGLYARLVGAQEKQMADRMAVQESLFPQPPVVDVQVMAGRLALQMVELVVALAAGPQEAALAEQVEVLAAQPAVQREEYLVEAAIRAP
jgi:hypothetical protein